MKALAAILLMSTVAFGQISSDEAAKKLQEKQVVRDAARSRPATITQGEVDDLRAEVSRLKAEVAKLKNDKVVTATAPVRLAKSIAVGMTKDELAKFVAINKDRYSVTADTGPSMRLSVKEMREVITGVGTNGINRSVETHKELRPSLETTLTITDGKISEIREEKVKPAPDEATPANVQKAINQASNYGKRR